MAIMNPPIIIPIANNIADDNQDAKLVDLADRLAQPFALVGQRSGRHGGGKTARGNRRDQLELERTLVSTLCRIAHGHIGDIEAQLDRSRPPRPAVPDDPVQADALRSS